MFLKFSVAPSSQPESGYHFSLIPWTAVDVEICISFSQEVNDVHYDYTNKRSYNLITRFNDSQTPPFHQFKMYIRYDDNVSIYLCP